MCVNLAVYSVLFVLLHSFLFFLMEEDLRAQEAFFQSGEIPSASVTKTNPKKSDSIADNAFQSILTPVKEVKERQVTRKKNDMSICSQNEGFPVAERINVIKFCF